MQCAEVISLGLSTRPARCVDNIGEFCLQYAGPVLTNGAGMPTTKSAEIRGFIIDNVGEHPHDIARHTSEKFGISRQAVGRHLASLAKDGLLEARGNTRKREYSLKAREIFHTLSLSAHGDEDKVWRMYVEPELDKLPDNVLRICYYGFTEIFNNAIDHSEGSTAAISIKINPKQVSLAVQDDGVGVFEKIKTIHSLEDHRQAIFALSKGKLTTDPDRHTGQGIFFTSRIFDRFVLYSSGLFLIHYAKHQDWLIETEKEGTIGTHVTMEIASDSPKSLKELFDEFADLESEDYGFSKTRIPLFLAKYGKETLISRSQAKRVLVGVLNFKEIPLDFKDIDIIGQAFADEIFRVFQKQHPEVTITPVNANEEVGRMIARAKKAMANPEGPDKK
jgi:DNA-binding transcriptional ArsR family regulator